MRTYSQRISLTYNSRGVYSLDPSIGCTAGTAENRNGCYNDCYAAKAARMYGYDFKKTVFRDFQNVKHRVKIVNQIRKIDLPFVRMGTMGDPSEDWQHTLNICRWIAPANKEIVIITKHWNKLTDEQLIELSGYNICVNTSVSALDEPGHLVNSVNEFLRLKPFCKSVLRIVSADFDLTNETGHRLAKVQAELFKHTPTLDTVLRVSKHNPYVKDGVIKIKESKFLGKKQYVSKYNRKTYLGHCGTCAEMCGVYKEKRPIKLIDYQTQLPL